VAECWTNAQATDKRPSCLDSVKDYIKFVGKREDEVQQCYSKKI